MPQARGGGATQQITVPNDVAGSIIGKGGSTISEIRNMSGASVNISASGPGITERMITLSGTPDQITTATYLIQQRVAAEQARQGLGAPGGGMGLTAGTMGGALGGVAADPTWQQQQLLQQQMFQQQLMMQAAAQRPQ